jgi:hypothetical protein
MNIALALIKIEDPTFKGKLRYKFKPIKSYGIDINDVKYKAVRINGYPAEIYKLDNGDIGQKKCENSVYFAGSKFKVF